MNKKEFKLPSHNIINIPYGKNFTSFLVRYILDNICHSSDLARTFILVPNRRAQLVLQTAFLKAVPINNLVVPQIISLTDIGNNPFGLKSIENLPSIISPLKKISILSHLILKFPGYKTFAQALTAAQSLETILDEMCRLNIQGAHVEKIFTVNSAEHWVKTLEFLKIITHQWPQILESEKVIDEPHHLQESLKILAEHWVKNPPNCNIIIAGSIGSSPGSTSLIKAVLSLDKGKFFIQGFKEIQWDLISDNLSHPQYNLRKLFRLLNVSISQVDHILPENKLEEDRQDIVECSTKDNPLILPKSFLPQHWPQMVTCVNLMEEARVIALMMRQAFETTKGPIVLITSNRNLAEWVGQELNRWNLVANQSQGKALSQAPPGRFLLSVADYLKDPSLLGLLRVLKHPFVAKSLDRQNHLEKVYQLEFKILKHADFKIENLDQEIFKRAPELLEWLRKFLKILEDTENLSSLQSLKSLLKKHLKICQNLTGDDSETCPLWDHSDGNALKIFFQRLEDEEGIFPLLSWETYPDVLRTLLGQTEKFHDPKGIQSRLFILDPFEARLVDAETLILGGLNEGDWPKTHVVNPWLNRVMRQQLGLPLPEWYIGLSAHNFYSCFYAPNLFLTRSQEEEGKLTLASRWWQRLEAIYIKNSLLFQNYKINPWKEQACHLLPSVDPIKIKPPAPCPSILDRPTRLYATEIQKLVFDPYSIYGKHCLKLFPLPAYKEPLVGVKKGQMIHSLLDRYTKLYGSKAPLLENLLSTAQPFFQTDVFSQTFWWKRFQNIASWIIDQLTIKPALARFSEQKGQVNLTVQEIEFNIAAIADRIDVNDDKMTIVDYKTGVAPRIKDIQTGFALQLAVEALILKKGGFPALAQYSNKGITIEVWQLGGHSEKGKVIGLDLTEDFLKIIEHNIKRLFEAFIDEKTPYLACPFPEHALFYNEYAHLERRDEWLGRKW